MNLNQRHFLLGGGLMTEEKDRSWSYSHVSHCHQPDSHRKKAGYVACSKSQRMKLADWLVRAIDFYVEYSFVLTALREQVPFSKLEVSRGGLMVS